MTKELLSQVAIMELRDQLEAKEQMIKNLKEKIKIYEKPLEIKEVLGIKIETIIDFRNIAIEKGYSNLEKFINYLRNS